MKSSMIFWKATLIVMGFLLSPTAQAVPAKKGQTKDFKPEANYTKSVGIKNDVSQNIKPIPYKQEVVYQQANDYTLDASVIMTQDRTPLEQYDPSADTLDEDASSEPQISETSTSEETSPSSKGDSFSGSFGKQPGLSDAEPVLDDDHVFESAEGSSSIVFAPVPSANKIGSALPSKDTEAEETTPENDEADPVFEAPSSEAEDVAGSDEEADTTDSDESAISETAEVVSEEPESETETTPTEATTYVKVRVVLNHIGDAGDFLDAALYKDDAVVLDFGSGDVTFKPSETTEGKGTLVVEFDNTANLSHDDFNRLVIQADDEAGDIDASISSYKVNISKVVKPEDVLFEATGSGQTADIDFATDTSATTLSRGARVYSLSTTVKHVLQYADGAHYESGHLDTALYFSGSPVFDFGSASESFTESSTVSGKGSLEFAFTSGTDLDFSKISTIDLKSDGTVDAELVSTTVSLEKVIKPSDTSLVTSVDSRTLDLPLQ